nr:GHKL domain-containing protein [uncultured Sellimonas sp.]
MSVINVTSFGIGIFLGSLAMYLFLSYFNIFMKRRKNNILVLFGSIVFFLWQIITINFHFSEVYLNIVAMIVVTIMSVQLVYIGNIFRKIIFVILFNSIGMLTEILANNILIFYYEKYAGIMEIGSIFSKLIFIFLVIILKKIFADDEMKLMPIKYIIMIIFLPMGSIYIMNKIFLLEYQVNKETALLNITVTAVIFLVLNMAVFFIYRKLDEDIRLRRTASVYEKQLELCEQHQHERELAAIELRDMKHNMKNDLILILTYAERGESEKIVEFTNELLDKGGMKSASVAHSGNLVVDSMIGYWHTIADKIGINFITAINIPMEMPFKGADLCLILGNLLENAIEAAEKVEGEKYIKVRMKYDKQNLLLYIENNYNGELKKGKNKALKSTKKNPENHGIGLASVLHAAKKYHGTVIIDDSVKGRFLVRVLLYGTNNNFDI